VLAATNPVISNADNAIDSIISASSVSEILNDRISDLQVDAESAKKRHRKFDLI
jgi:hypothetical protein